MLMNSSELPPLPSLHISLLNDVPYVEQNSDRNSCRNKIQFALKYLANFNLRSDRIMDGLNVSIYERITKTPSLLGALVGEDSENNSKRFDYLIFLFKKPILDMKYLYFLHLEFTSIFIIDVLTNYHYVAAETFLIFSIELKNFRRGIYFHVYQNLLVFCDNLVWIA